MSKYVQPIAYLYVLRRWADRAEAEAEQMITAAAAAIARRKVSEEVEPISILHKVG